jgi:hypothetical protein
LSNQSKELFGNDNNHFRAVPFYLSVYINNKGGGNPMNMNTNAPKKMCATLKTINQAREKKVAQLISDETTFKRKEAEMSLDQLEKVLLRLLLDSNSSNPDRFLWVRNGLETEFELRKYIYTSCKTSHGVTNRSKSVRRMLNRRNKTGRGTEPLKQTGKTCEAVRVGKILLN